jgi:hypothetical protein
MVQVQKLLYLLALKNIVLLMVYIFYRSGSV